MTASQLQQKEGLLSTKDDVETTSSSSSSSLIQTYSGRWWIVATYSLFACMQGATWALPGSIQPTMQQVYNIDGNAIQLLLNWGPIGWMVTCVPLSWHMDRFGCRFSVLVSCWLVFFSQLLRIFASDASMTSVVLVHASFILNAFAGPVAMAAVSKISEDWFTKSERTTATAVMAEANNCAGILMWLLVPVLCSDENESSLMNMNYCLLALSSINLVMALIYFPAHPPTPPSASAAVQKANESSFTLLKLWTSVVTLTKDTSFFAIMFAYSCIAGMANSLSGLLVSILSNIGYTQTQSGWIGFASSLLGMILGVALARYTDKARNQRFMILLLLTVSGIFYGVFAVAAQGWLPTSLTSGTIGYIMVGVPFTACNVFFDAAIPLFFELSVEATYPIPEATVLMYMTTAMNVATLIILSAPMDTFGVTWMPWAMAGITIVCTVLIAAVFANSSPRYHFDLEHDDDEGIIVASSKEAEGKGRDNDGDEDADGVEEREESSRVKLLVN